LSSIFLECSIHQLHQSLDYLQIVNLDHDHE
jgi:hypothetical protein